MYLLSTYCTQKNNQAKKQKQYIYFKTPEE